MYFQAIALWLNLVELGWQITFALRQGSSERRRKALKKQIFCA